MLRIEKIYRKYFRIYVLLKRSWKRTNKLLLIGMIITLIGMYLSLNNKTIGLLFGGGGMILTLIAFNSELKKRK